MNPRRLALALASSAILLPLIACGASNPATTTPTSPASTLAGNWLLAGTLPVPYLAPLNNGSTGLTATFDTIGSEVTGIVIYQYPCASPQGLQAIASFGAVVTGAVASDGSFTLTTPAPLTGLVPELTFTLQGKLPSTAGGAWTGTGAYTLNTSSNLCAPSANAGSIPIAATSIPLLSGTYTGTATGALLPATPSVTISTALRQSAAETNSAGTSYTSNIPLSGNISITGSSCLTSGTPYEPTLPSPAASPLPAVTGFVEGNSINVLYQMNDSSILSLHGSISKSDASQIVASLATVHPGTCNTNAFWPPFTLTKQ